MVDKTKLIGFERHEYNPILRSRTEELLKKILLEKSPKHILEIGTFIGYSASVMLECCKDAYITSLEKDKQNSLDAIKNLTNMGFSGRFEVICCDAFQYLQDNENKKFDLIFLDGPKGQYIKYLPYLKKMLNLGGVLVADDVLFYGLVDSSEHIAHKHRTIVMNLRKFLSQLQEDADFKTDIYDFEDGVSVSLLLK